jgi:hypothetical protein
MLLLENVILNYFTVQGSLVPIAFPFLSLGRREIDGMGRKNAPFHILRARKTMQCFIKLYL